MNILLIASIIIVVGITCVFLFIENLKKNNQIDRLKNKVDYHKYTILNYHNNYIDPELKKPVTNTNPPQTDLITERDYRTIYDPLMPASIRPPRHILPSYIHGLQPHTSLVSAPNVLNVPTRGIPDNYQYLGNLFRKTDEKVIKLFGRQKYPGSFQYEYYGISADASGLDYKIPITVKGDKEIMDADQVTIPVYEDGKGSFTAYINPDKTLKYNPYII